MESNNNYNVPAEFSPQTNGDLTAPAVAMSASESAAIAMATQQKAIVEARYKMALARPRDLDLVRQKMLKDASRPSFANVAIYHKPVGNGIEGPSIRFVESAIRNMTNILTETSTVSEDDERRVIRVAVSDLETNTYFSQDVTVTKTVERRKLPQGEKPIRVRANSNGQPIYILHATDDEILNKQNALISKAVRTLGLRLIPGDLVDEALWEIKKTMAQQDRQDPDAAKHRIIDAFAQLGVSVEALKEFVGHELSALTPNEIQLLRTTYTSIKDGETSWKAVMDDKAEKEANAKEKAKQAATPTSAKKAETKKAETVTEKAQTRNDKKSAAPKAQPTVTDAEVVEDSETEAEPEDSDMFA
jgi:hypothetical protein